MDFEVHCMSILPTELSLFNYDKVNSVLQSMTPLSLIKVDDGMGGGFDHWIHNSVTDRSWRLRIYNN